MMTQEEINKLMRSGDDAPPANNGDEYSLDGIEKDAIGEVSNICMGTCATTLSTLLNKRVNITTPRVEVGKIESHVEEFIAPFIAVDVEYTEGINGYNILILKEEDVLLMTDLLMGGEGTVAPGAQMDELAFSAISEVMNQMVGSSSTSLANVLDRTINISTPKVKKVDIENPDLSEFISDQEMTIKISFTMEIEGLLVSNIMQIIPFESGKEILSKILGTEEEESAPAPQPNVTQTLEPQPAPIPQHEEQIQSQPVAHEQPAPVKEQSMVGVKAVQYQSFDGVQGSTGGIKDKDNMGLLMEVPLNVTVELGTSKKSIKEILSLTMGSVLVLNRMAGEMVDIMVNGVLFAVGEVVVIDDNYGVRITEIIKKPV